MFDSSLSSHAAENFAAVDLGNLSNLSKYSFEAPGLPFKVEGKIFLNQFLSLTSAEISLNQLLPQKSIPFYHKHRLNEEVYLFISGEGEFQVDGVIFPVKEGTVVRVDPEGERCIRNCSETSRLHWIVIQARAHSYTNHTIEDGVGIEKRVSWVKKN